MANSCTSDKPVEAIEALCRQYRRGEITSERCMAKIITIASGEMLLSVEEQENSPDCIPILSVW